MEAKREHLAIAWLERLHDSGELGRILAALELLKGRRALLCDLEWTFVLATITHLVERGHGAFPREVDNEVARDGEDPGVEARLAVVLRAAPEDADPDLLEEVLSHLALVRQEHEITHQPMLIGLDEMVEQLRVLPLEAASYRSVFTLNLSGGFGGQCDRGLHVQYRRESSAKSLGGARGN